jgi:hydrogenase nickel incorporation protein HypB
MQIKVVKNILDANNRIAEENRKIFNEKGIFVINLMSSPGAGKTSFLEKVIPELLKNYKVAVIEGDIQDTYDAEKIAKLNIPVVQINTGGACHIDGNMVKETLPDLPLNDIDILILENVGNLVCPAEFNIGENLKIMLLSVTEGDDKPMKYPLMFKVSQAMVINKIDLLPYVEFNIDKAKNDALKINPELKSFEVSCKTGDGLDLFINWLKSKFQN